MPKLSVIISCYNLGAYLQEALASCTMSDSYEVIVVDDGSNEETQAIIERLKTTYSDVRFVRQVNQGVEAARNNGTAMASGELILPLDADNYLIADFAERFENEIWPLFADDKIDVYYTDRFVFGEERGRIDSRPFDALELIRANYIDTCSIFRKSLFDRSPGFPRISNVTGNEDWLLWMEFVQLKARFHYASHPIFHYRVRQGSQIRSFNRLSDDYLGHVKAVTKLQLATLHALKGYSKEAKNSLQYDIEKEKAFRTALIGSYWDGLRELFRVRRQSTNHTRDSFLLTAAKWGWQRFKIRVTRWFEQS